MEAQHLSRWKLSMDWTKGAHNTLSCCNTYGSWKRCVLFTACWMKNLKHLNDKTTNPVWCRNIRKCKGWQLVKPFTEKSTHLIFWVNRRIRTDEPRLTSEAVWRTNFSYQNIHMVPNWSNVSLVEHLFFCFAEISSGTVEQIHQREKSLVQSKI